MAWPLVPLDPFGRFSPEGGPVPFLSLEWRRR